VQSPSPSPDPGWYPDPARPGRHRYWDGQAWTPRPGEAATADDIDVRAVAIVVVLAIAILAVAIGGRNLVGTTGDSTATGATSTRSTTPLPDINTALPDIGTDPSTPSTEAAPPSTYLPADEMPSASPDMRMWMATYGYVLVAVQSAANRISGDLQRNDLDGLAIDCRSLVKVAEEGRGTAPVPVASVDQHWKASLAGFAAGARLCNEAASTSSGAKWEQARQYFIDAGAEWDLATEGMQSAQK